MSDTKVYGAAPLAFPWRGRCPSVHTGADEVARFRDAFAQRVILSAAKDLKTRGSDIYHAKCRTRNLQVSPLAFPSRGRWRGEAVTDEVSNSRNASVQPVILRHSRRILQHPPPTAAMRSVEYLCCKILAAAKSRPLGGWPLARACGRSLSFHSSE